MRRARIARIARNVLPIIAEQAVLALLFLGVVIAVSGCDVIYQPECDYQCEGTGGADTYGRSNP